MQEEVEQILGVEAPKRDRQQERLHQLPEVIDVDGQPLELSGRGAPPIGLHAGFVLVDEGERLGVEVEPGMVVGLGVPDDRYPALGQQRQRTARCPVVLRLPEELAELGDLRGNLVIDGSRDSR